MTDDLLATTRAVRKRLDLDRPVPREIITECLELAVQAPTGGNTQLWRWIVVDDPAQKTALANIYRRVATDYLANAREEATASGQAQTARVYDSAHWLAENFHKVPMIVIPCVRGRPPADADTATLSGIYGSIFPAVWSFQLALRARGLGSALTTLHLIAEQEAADLLGLPENVLQVAMLPVGYTRGTDFKRAERPPVDGIIHWNRW
ncbi:MAG: nitroreductase family protein [Sphingomonadales bacterium]|nr:MAG: nitroreductase family protein [Sphingomonadales bacterium]